MTIAGLLGTERERKGDGGGELRHLIKISCTSNKIDDVKQKITNRINNVDNSKIICLPNTISRSIYHRIHDRANNSWERYWCLLFYITLSTIRRLLHTL